jgi:translation elongation factor EF-Ts
MHTAAMNPEFISQDQSEYTVVDSKLILNAGQSRKVIRVNETVQEEDNFYG